MVKFNKDLEGMLWDGQMLAPDYSKRKVPELSIRLGIPPLRLQDWEDFWERQGKRVATLPEVYLAAKVGKICFPKGVNFMMTSTNIDYSQNWEVMSIQNSMGALQATNPCKNHIPLLDALTDNAFIIKHITETNDSTEKMYAAWLKYFQRDDTHDLSRVYAHFSEDRTDFLTKRQVALMGGIQSGLTFIFNAIDSEGYSYGVDK